MKKQQIFVKGLVSTLLMVSIISTTKAEIPFTEARGIYTITKEKYKAISPFWAMVAIHGKLLERIRFFGFYQKNSGGYDEPIDKDHIAALLLQLFPSPDGVQFVANTRQKDPVGDLSRNLPTINEIIEGLLLEKEKDKKIQDISTILGRISKSEATSFATILVNAYEQDQKGDPRYPKNIVIISLLSFFVKVADNKSQLIKGLPLLFEVGKEEKEEKDALPPYKQYLKYKSELLSKIIENPENLELTFFMAKGFEAYERLVAEPVNYRSDIIIKGADAIFSDCGETSLRNFVMLLLSAGNNGIVPEKNLISLEKAIKPVSSIELAKYAPYQNFIKFIVAHPDITQGALQEVHNAWAEVVSRLNEDKEPTKLEDIQYGRRLNPKKRTPYIYEIKSNASQIGAISIINMFNVIARIIPDEVLNEPWSSDKDGRYKQVEKKLNRLSTLFSREDLEISWKDESTGKPEINSDFMTIIFMIHGKDAFKWRFQDGHFQIDLVSNPQEDWRVKLSYYPKHPNEWMASLFPRLIDIKEETNYVALFPISVIYNPTLKTLEGVMKTIQIVLDKKMKNFYPLIIRWIQHSIPLNNSYFLINITEFLCKYLSSISTDGDAKNILNKAIDSIIYRATKEGMFEQNIVALALQNNQIHAAKLFILNKANLEASDANGNAPLHLAVLQENIEILEILTKLNANINVTGIHARTPLHVAVLRKNTKIVPMLLAAKANVDAKDNNGYTPLHFAVAQGDLAIIDMLIKAKANLEAEDKDGFTPLHLAALQRNLVLVNLLLKYGASAKTKNIHEETILMSIAGKHQITEDEQRNYIEIMKLLISAGAEINAKDGWGDTCLDHAENKGHEKIKNFLKESGAKKGSE